VEYADPNTLQQNGLVERQFATEWARSKIIMEATELTEDYCNKLRGEAINTESLLYIVICNKGEKFTYELYC
jgi:hypothetical protein